MATGNFLVDFGIEVDRNAVGTGPAPSSFEPAPYITDMKNISKPTIDPIAPEYEKWGLNSEEEFDLMESVKAQGGSADDFTFVLNDFRQKSHTIEQADIEEDISGLDIGVKAGKGLSEFGKDLKVGGVQISKDNVFTGIGKTIGNIPGDAIEAIGETVELLSDPIGAAKGIGSLFMGLMEKSAKLGGALGVKTASILLGESGSERELEALDVLSQERPNEATVAAVATMIEEDYGSVEKAIETITANPVDTIFLLKNVAKAAAKVKGADGDKFKAIDKTLSEKLNDSAIKDIEQALGTTKEKFKQKGRDIAPEIIKRGITGSKEEIQQLAQAKVSDFGGKINDFIDSGKLTGTVKRDDLLNVLDDIRKQGQVGDVIIDESIVKATDNFADIISGFGKEIPADKARIIRQMFDDAVYNTKGIVSEEALSLKNNIKKGLADSIREQLSVQNPDLADLNREFSFYKKVDDVLTETINRQGPQSGGLTGNISAGGGLGAGAVIFGDISGAIATAAAAKLLTDAMKSTKWKTVSAQTKTKLANALSSGDKLESTRIINKIAREVLNKKTELLIGGQVTESNLELNE